ncbi:MAG: dynamin family protein [Desulfobacterales bacterium]|nr:MAG: dynamin family protein [Desulfobacterales bacterium]
MFKKSHINQRLRELKKRLKEENPVLSKVVDSFQELDQISRRLGYFDKEESHAIRTSWWPLISVLGIYSSGKSTFINHYLHQKLQATGNQAVDDKFTVICFTNDDKVRVLPGLALDADPRFPFYKISQAIEEVAEGEGQRIDSYLQLKTCPSELLRGKILIDSPGFDADAQRTSTLRITDHIIDLSDLVLVFFDARHPESGSMRDTLEHLVSRTINRRDSNKFIYVLNQIDSTALEDNTEEVFASWQRALAQYGLTAGSCYAVYMPEVAVPIEDEMVRARFENKRNSYLGEIFDRIERVGEERAYRIVGILEETAQTLEQDIVPRIQRFLSKWRRKVLWLDGIIFGGMLVALLVVSIWGGYWSGFSLKLPFLDNLPGGSYTLFGIVAVLLLSIGYVHYTIRRWTAKRTTQKLLKEVKDSELQPFYFRAFKKNSSWYRSIFNRQPIGWSKRTHRRLATVLEDTNAYIQKLNDMYTNPAGDKTFIPVMGPKTSGKTPTSKPWTNNSAETDPDNDDQNKAEQ